MGATSQPSGVVTFLLTDVVGSTRQWQQAPASMDEAIERHCQIIAAAVDAFDGHLLKPRGEGDSTFSVFARSSNALRAAHRAQIALRQEQWPESAPILVRFAVHAGEAIERDGDYFGSVVNRAARLRSIAQGGEILVSEAAAALVVDDLPTATGLEDLGPVHLRDLDREERVFALLADGLVVPTSLAAGGAELERSLEVRLLGPCELVSARGTLDLGGPKECATLALLSMANGPLSPDELIDELWSGRPPSSARKTLQTYIWRLRRKLGDALTTVTGAYELRSPVSDCDAVRFERLVREAHLAMDDGAVEQAGHQLDEALALWRGQPFSGCASTVALESHAARLYERRIEAVESRLAVQLELGHHEEIIGELEAAVRDTPLREGLWSKLALALYRCGRAADALRTLDRARHAIVDEAGLDPGPALRELEQAILEQRPELDFRRPPATEVVLGPGPSDVAPLNPLVGRQREIAALMAMHRDHRLITVTGLGGCGKTHLVRAVAGELSSGRPVYLCELSLISSGTAVVHAIARSAGLPLDRLAATGGPEDALIEHLRPRSQLLILDSCEHVLEECVPLVERLLGSCPRLQIVATSRIPLGVPGEQVVHLDPLPVPLDDRDVAADAVRLFVQRAAEARVGFTLTAENTAAVVEICRRLDGLPLGLELAAARMSALSAHEVVERMDRRFELLAARHDHGRRRTLLAALDWSHDLLSIEAQVLLRRLSIFSARFDASAIEASCGQHLGGRDVLDVLSELVDASLVVVEHEPVSTYRLLDTVRVYAARRLTDQEELDGCRAALGEWLSRRLDAVPWDTRLLSLAFFDQLEDAHEELRATLEWAEARGRTDLVTRLVPSMTGLLGYGMFVDEIAHWYPIAIEHERSLPPGERVATVLSAWAFVNVYGGGVAALVAQIDRLAALAENRPAHDVLTGFAYATLASLCSRLPDEQRPWEKYADLALEHTPSEARRVRGMAVCQKTRAMVFRGDLTGARDVLDRALMTSSDSDHDTPFTVVGDLALVEHLQGSFDRALQAGEAFSLSFAVTNVGRWDYHVDLFHALSTAALGDEVTARQRLSVVVDRLEASPHPAAMKDLRLALGASALINQRLSVAAPLLAGLEPETMSTNILGLLTRHYQARARAQVDEATWDGARATSTGDIERLVADEVAAMRAAVPS